VTLKGKVAVVTGGNSGIGKAIALGLAKAGTNIAIDYVTRPEATDALVREIGALGGVAIGVKADVSRIEELQAIVQAAVAKFGRRLDIMVNNAGVETRTSVLDTTEAQYDRVLAINLKSAFFGTQIAAKQMITQRGGGRIINITSVHEDWPMPGNTAYCLAKGRHEDADPYSRDGARTTRHSDGWSWAGSGGNPDQPFNHAGPGATGEAQCCHHPRADG
jgi:glucose 1-dehydrogenase